MVVRIRWLKIVRWRLLLQQFHLNLNCFQQLGVLALAHKFGVHVHFIVG